MLKLLIAWISENARRPMAGETFGLTSEQYQIRRLEKRLMRMEQATGDLVRGNPIDPNHHWNRQ